MAPCSFASRVIPRITDSVKPCVRRAVRVRMTAKDTVLTTIRDGGWDSTSAVIPSSAVLGRAEGGGGGGGPRDLRAGSSLNVRQQLPRRDRPRPPLCPRGDRTALPGRRASR